MLVKAVALFLAIGAVYAASVPTPIEIESQNSLVDLLLSSPAMRSDIFNPDCVDFYTPLLKGHVDKYNEDFNTCNYNYENAYSLIDESFAYARNQLANSVKETCVSLLTCDGKTQNYDAFECLAVGGPFASKELEQASYKAADNQTSLQGKLSEIQATRSVCHTEAYRTYNINHGECYSDMIACLGDPNWEMPTTNYVEY
ncbi:uncharacterized protein LOC108026031 [Drosophila biarmipes]|uniref:uncharacterized protein LOC108026031 n=1 Tax=Drosophila biarmipes TaxID=125945 RepID=UPI0007E5EBFD|nr:uncharacterized protein LOC108026031 [Drosophila biarmipes]